MSGPFAILRANPETAADIERILGITSRDHTGAEWGNFTLTMEANDVASASIEFHLSREQLIALVSLTEEVS